MSNSIPVSIDKSHITTIGEKLYGESLELIRELVSNAYDADATRVWIQVEVDRIKVRDDGTGMDEAGLREYFTIGSQNKVNARISQRYRRQKIGQFGIGKFAVLTACNRFRLVTQRDGYAAEVVFDRKDWQENDQWRLPILTQNYDPMMGNGTVVILEQLKRTFSIPEIAHFVRERIPLQAPHFEVHLNKQKVEPIYIAGQRFPIGIQTAFGVIQGEIIAPNFKQKISEAKVGIETTVSGVLIRRERFDFEDQPLFTIHKLLGRVSADFIPITSDRSRFITDTSEYQTFVAAMKKELKKISHLLQERSALKQKQKTDETLKDTMTRLGKAIRKNPSFSPQVMSPTGEVDPTSEHPNSLAPETDEKDPEAKEAYKMNIDSPLSGDFQKSMEEGSKDYNKERIAKVRKVKVKNLAGKMLVARRIKIGGLGIVCNVESFGKEEKPVFTEGGVIYVNQDHPLYQKQARCGRENLSFYLAYLLSQQIALMVAMNDPHQAFEIQNKLLSDTF